jgi:hypothetical protein
MMGLVRCTGVTLAVLTLGLASPSGAQENLDAGKTGAQIFASDCTLCHKSPQALNKSGSLFGLSGFLREHYTASKESADAVAKYLASIPDSPAPAAKRTGSPKRTAKGDEKTKLEGKKLEEKKPGEKKPEAKSGEEKSPKSTEKKSTDAKPADAKPESKTDEKKPAEAKASEPKPQSKSESKPDKPEKSE